MLSWFLFFFQAEDGIRDLVRSRGLGDVYKRQGRYRISVESLRDVPELFGTPAIFRIGTDPKASSISVSYTHLTLPTSDLV